MKTFACEGDFIEIQRRLKTVCPESRRRWGRMTAHQMICHVNDSFLAVTGRKETSMATGPFQRTVFKWMALYAPLPWPHGVRTRPEIDQTVGGTPPSDFATDVALLEALSVQFIAEINTIEGRWHHLRTDVTVRLAALGLPAHGSPPAPVQFLSCRSVRL